MSHCLHCDIRELLGRLSAKSRSQSYGYRGKGKKRLLADLILLAPPDEQSALMANALANIGSFLLERKTQVIQLVSAIQAISGMRAVLPI